MVRISKAKKTFEKGYRSNWTREIFQVDRVYKRALPEYGIKDLQGEEILGKFLEYELQGVQPNETQSYRIRKVIRKSGPRTLVSWEGYPEAFQTWIPTKDLKRYK